MSGLDGRLNEQDTRNQPTAADYRRERFALHGVIRRHLIAVGKELWPGQHVGNHYRTAACTWVPVAGIDLVRPQRMETFHYKGLVTCGSVWVCPLCSSKIQERRRQEVAQALTWSKAAKAAPVMVSFTFPHRVDQPLAMLLRLQRDALARMRARRDYKALMGEVQAKGRIRALEVTHGQNGWHPHTHELVFCGIRWPASWLRVQLSHLWFKACRSVGLFLDERDRVEDFMAHAVDVLDGHDGVAGYLAKLDDQKAWGLSHELTKASSKQGRRTGAHPFRLALEKGTRDLFIEYVDSMKGQRQLVWSRGLKAAVGVKEMTDEEIAQADSAKADERIPIDRNGWRAVQRVDARWMLTEAARAGGQPEVERCLRRLGWRNDDG